MAKKKQRKTEPTAGNELTPSALGLPPGYAELLEDLKGRVRTAQLKAAVAANREMIQLYWDIGRLIVERQEREGWGKGIVDHLARDIQKAFPGLAGFSPSNVSRMRAFYLAYTKELAISAQPVPKLDGPESAQAVPILEGQQPPDAVAAIPWGHNVIFAPEDAGQMNFYLSAVDDNLRHPDDKPTIGLILCKTQNRVIAEYALRDLAKPIGVAEWQIKLVQSLPEDLRGSLPTIEQIEAELASEGESPEKPK